MPRYANTTEPPWNEYDSVRETTLQLIDDPEGRDAVRRAGRMLYHLAVAATRELGAIPGDPSITRAELRAVAADLRYTGGYLLHVIRRSAEESVLNPADDRLARFAGKLAARVGALAEKIERQLSMSRDKGGSAP
jgi:hypothetical protein